VLYEECLDDEVVRDTVEAMSQADMLIVAGTSLSVYPAASFLRYFKGKYSVVINLAMQEKETRADLVFYEKVGDILSRVDVAYCTE
jgi:NAD-dependent deacetylase